MMEHEDERTVRLDSPLPAATAGALLALYAAPHEASYWAGLEARIMARLATVQLARPAVPQWWQILDEWGRAGLVAAAAVLAVVGALFMRAQAAELRTAYDAVTAAPSTTGALTLPAGALTEREGPDVREVTFREVLSQ